MSKVPNFFDEIIGSFKRQPRYFFLLEKVKTKKVGDGVERPMSTCNLPEEISINARTGVGHQWDEGGGSARGALEADDRGGSTCGR